MLFQHILNIKKEKYRSSRETWKWERMEL